jgi:hypothetical protein
MRSGAGLAVVLAALGAMGLVLLLAVGGDDEGGSGAGFDRADAEAGTEAALGGSGVRLETRGDGLPRAPRHVEAGSDGPAAPTFPASEGIGGRVLDGRGSPVAGATVKLIPHPAEDLWRWGAPDRPAVATTTSGKDGTFLVGPAPEGRLKVRAEAEGYAPTSQQVARRGTRVDLILDVGGTLALKVRDMANKPVAGATVSHNAGTVVLTGTTSPEGALTFSSVPTGTGTLLVTHKAYAALRQNEVAVAPGKALELTLVLSKGIDLRGTVVRAADDRPVEGAKVQVSYPNVPGTEPSEPTTSGDDGAFQLTLAAGVGEQVEVVVRHPEFAEARVNQNVVDPGTRVMQMTVKLTLGGEPFRGRVVGADRGAIAGATVTYGYLPVGAASPEVKTDASGGFELPLPAWGTAGSGWFLVAGAPGEGVGAAHAQVPKREEGRGKPIEIRLSGAGKVEGKVTDGAGKPVAGALVSLQVDWNVQGSGGRGGRQVDWMVLQTVQDPKRFNLAAVSGPEGDFTIDGVPAASYRATAQWGLDQGTLPDAIAVSAGGATRADLVIGAGATIEGWVMDTEDRPVAGAYVHAQPQEQRGYGTWPYGRAQSDGKFVLRGVGEGGYTVYAGASGYGSANEKNVRSGAKDMTLRLTALGWIEGVVLLDGEPLRGAFTATARRQGERAGEPTNRYVMGGGGWVNDSGASEMTQTFSTDDGRFTIRGLVAGDWLVTISTGEGYIASEPQRARVTDGRATTGVTLTLTRGATVSGVIVGERDGRPVANAWVNVVARPGAPNPGTTGGAQADAEGRFVVRGLATGAYVAWVYNQAGTNWSEPLDLRAGQDVQVRFTERVPGRIHVSVTDPQGVPLAGASPIVTSEAGVVIQPNWQAMTRDGLLDRSSGDAWQRATITDAAGTNMRHHVPPGRYRVSAALKGYAPPADAPWVEVVGDTVTPIVVVLTPLSADAAAGGR